MKILDLDMDYFLTHVYHNISDNSNLRIQERFPGEEVWAECRVKRFIEDNLGLSKKNKIRGRVVTGHNESLFLWKDLIEKGELLTPFEVVHVDSHADLGLGYLSPYFITKELLAYPVNERLQHSSYLDSDKQKGISIGDYLLFAIAYRWISKLTYCSNPNNQSNDYPWFIIKDFKEKNAWRDSVENIIQLLYNPNMEVPDYRDNVHREKFLNASFKEPEVPFCIIPTSELVHFKGDFDFAVLAQSPNYTPESADFIMDIFREYIIEE